MISICLMPLNWWIEWLKWDLIYPVKENGSIILKRHGFFAGMVTGMVTPGLVGNFIGRSYYSEKQKRPEVVYLTLLSNLSQFLCSIVFGVLALWLLHETPLNISFKTVFFTAGFILLMVSVLFVFAGKPWQWLGYFFPSLQLKMQVKNSKALFLGLSLFRHLVFTAQFALMLHAFGAIVTWELFLWIWEVYLFVTLVPSVFFGKVIVRDSIAVFVLVHAGVGMTPSAIFASSLSVWLINLFVPFIIAILLLRRRSYVDAFNA